MPASVLLAESRDIFNYGIEPHLDCLGDPSLISGSTGISPASVMSPILSWVTFLPAAGKCPALQGDQRALSPPLAHLGSQPSQQQLQQQPVSKSGARD